MISDATTLAYLRFISLATVPTGIKSTVFAKALKGSYLIFNRLSLSVLGPKTLSALVRALSSSTATSESRRYQQVDGP